MEPLADRTLEVALQIEILKEFYVQGDVVTLDYNLKRPFIRVLKSRWSVEKPDGTRVGISEDGSEIAFSSSGWMQHEHGTTFKKMGFQGNYIDYTLASKGRYVFYLDSMITDITTTTMDPTTHTDVRIVHSLQDTAQVSMALPVSVGTVNAVAFDAFGRPWVVGESGTATRLNFHYDTYLTDFTNKGILLREDYENVEVEA